MHTGTAGLHLDGAIDKLYHRMHDTFGMDDHLNTLIGDIEEPIGFNHLQPFVHEGRAINGNLWSHTPGRMRQRLFDSHLFHLLEGRVAKRSARSSENQMIDLAPLLPTQTLPDGAMLTIYRPYGDIIAP